jgi:hypothetical protein
MIKRLSSVKQAKNQTTTHKKKLPKQNKDMTDLFLDLKHRAYVALVLVSSSEKGIAIKSTKYTHS